VLTSFDMIVTILEAQRLSPYIIFGSQTFPGHVWWLPPTQHKMQCVQGQEAT
jgi:hypothetical protein